MSLMLSGFGVRSQTLSVTIGSRMKAPALVVGPSGIGPQPKQAPVVAFSSSKQLAEHP